MRSGMNMSAMKETNRRAILQCIYEEGPMSRKDLAAATGLTQASLTQISSALIQEGILEESGAVSNQKAGRKKVLLDINCDYGVIAVMNIDREKTVFSICNLKGNVLDEKQIRTLKAEPEKFLQKAGEEMLAMIQNCPADILGLSVGIAGSVRDGISRKENGIWRKNVNVAGILTAATKLDVIVENNVSAFVIGEKLFGTKKAENLLAVKWGPGLGSAIMIKDHLYEGKERPELGRFLDQKGQRLENKVSLESLRKIDDFSPDTFYLHCTEEKYSPVFDALSTAVVNAASLLRPDAIVIYGDLCQEEAVSDCLIHACLAKDAGTGKIMYHSSLLEKENYIGPAAVYIERRLF